MEASGTVQITMPQMGESVSEGTVLTWHKHEGDWVEKDETVVEISTDKVDAEVPAPASGKLVRIIAAEDETVTVGDPLAELEVGASPDGAGGGTDGAGSAQTEAPAEAAAPRDAAVTAAGRPAAEVPEGERVTPVARRVAAAHGIDLREVDGSGTGGRIVKEDVLAYIDQNGGDGAATVAPSAPATAPAREAPKPPPAGAELMRGSDAMLARYMTESLKIPTATSFRTFAVTTLDARRRQLNQALKDAGHDAKASFTHLIGYAIIRAVADHPAMAHSFQEVDGKPHRVVPEHVNLGLAVDVQREDGSRTLIVPVIKGGESMSFAKYREVYEELIRKTRTGEMSPDDLQGATVTLTNPGGLGTVASVPRLMPGQGCIIATGAIGPPAGVSSADKVMTMTSTYDHRVIQGAESGAFLGRIEALLQGEDSFYEDVFESLGVSLPPLPKAEAAAPAPTRPAAQPVSAPAEELVPKEMLYHVQAATSLVKAHRMHGHLAARLDPLGSEPIGDPALEPETVGLTPEVMAQIPAEVLRIEVPGRTLAEALPHLREIYCGTIAYEIEHISDHRQRVWLRKRIESGEYRRPLMPEEKLRVLRRLTEVETFETYIRKAFLGKKSFSIEGLDMLIPMLDDVFDLSARQGAREALIGMAHRGRLNVQAHACGRPYREILAEFEGEKDVDIKTARPRGGTGDVKYHQGLQGTFTTPSGHTVKVTLAHNPSHLEFVDPVVEGRTRAEQTDRRGSEPKHDHSAALPILIHGDSAFPGEGVVAETLNLQALEGYSTGGTIHVIANNQVGFTTEPSESRSTRYASDLAKGFDIPIVHVNADDPEACIAAVRLAMAYRQEFKRGVVIDLIGYRRLGHNETDEPAYTQPLMYKLIKQHPSVRKVYAEALVKQGLVSEEEVDKLVKGVHERLSEAHEEVKLMSPGAQTEESALDRTRSVEPDTTVAIDSLVDLNRQLFSTPENFNVHPKLKPQREKRLEVGPDDPIDWAHAEALALAALLEDGVPLRLTGQDTVRGTFSQRHLALFDVETGRKYAPIQHLREAKAPFELYNSPLSEVAALGFEYGYSATAPEALVLWEAQFGDFVNVAQMIIDQFLVSALAKWGETSRLTLLLPHGYEGAGPEHSSARIERFLTLAAEGNIRVANVTTPAQYFHLLRRQALIEKRRPLVVFTPKSLLRDPRATSLFGELTRGGLQRVIDDSNRAGAREKVKRLILCSGRIYYDITGSDQYAENEQVAVARIEMLYPFPEEELVELIARYPNVEEVVWVQEEPKNMGARRFMFTRSRERDLMPESVSLGYVGRPYRASPGEGYPAAHHVEQARIVSEALTPGRGLRG
jgi:2-oxoglutarate dehydrogenase E1 component